jgi:asparagine synthase (glutamine-hydrolysing)
VAKRVKNTDRPIACLLSGGLDSSLITALVRKHYGMNELHTWSIGLKGSDDLKHARIVADHLKTIHHEICLTEQQLLDAIETVIFDIESYDTTTVRASVPNWLICKYIKEQTESKVIFNGDGSDELTGGYMYFYNCPDIIEFDKECKRLLEDIYYFDVLRSDRSISTNGLEPRTPFLDRAFVDFYLSISSKIRWEYNNKQEKYLFRKAFDKNYLPYEILWRKKEAFSDGVSKKSRSWFEIIAEKVKTQKEIKFVIIFPSNF